jgi:hypothetical protein
MNGTPLGNEIDRLKVQNKELYEALRNLYLVCPLHSYTHDQLLKAKEVIEKSEATHE